MKKMIFVFVFVSAIASVSLAQTKVSGSIKCDKPDPEYMIQVGDHPNHAVGVDQAKCTWTKPMELATIASKDGSSTSSMEVSGTTVHVSGYHMSNMANGDQFFVSFHGTAAMKEGKPGNSSGTWTFTGGTGKLKGIKGKGTWKGAPTEDGGNSYEVEGDYTLSASK